MINKSIQTWRFLSQWSKKVYRREEFRGSGQQMYTDATISKKLYRLKILAAGQQKCIDKKIWKPVVKKVYKCEDYWASSQQKYTDAKIFKSAVNKSIRPRGFRVISKSKHTFLGNVHVCILLLPNSADILASVYFFWPLAWKSTRLYTFLTTGLEIFASVYFFDH